MPTVGVVGWVDYRTTSLVDREDRAEEMPLTKECRSLFSLKGQRLRFRFAGAGSSKDSLC